MARSAGPVARDAQRTFFRHFTAKEDDGAQIEINGDSGLVVLPEDE